jgi:ABC-2 type transport system ATP-binding protein
MSVAATSNLQVKYGPRTVLHDLSLEVPEGCVGLLGPNGAGKTTLIKTLLGFLTPAHGTATVLGMNVATDSLRIRQRIGLMPEQECHIPGMNAVSFVGYAGELAGMPTAQALRRAHEVLQYCGLAEARYRPVEDYSTGMKQRIKLAQALVHGPRLLFLDEPTNGLDPDGRQEMLELIRSISHGKDVNVIVSSHLLEDIERICDAVIIMKGGAVVTQGEMAELRGAVPEMVPAATAPALASGAAGAPEPPAPAIPALASQQFLTPAEIARGIAPAAPGLQVDTDLREPSEAFIAAVAARGGVLIARGGTNYRFSFLNGAAVNDAAIGRVLFEAAAESGAQLRGFQRSHRGLKEIFMEAVQ